MPMAIGQVKRSQVVQKFWGNTTAMCKSHNLFLSISFKNITFNFERELALPKKHQLISTFLITIHWVKPAQRTEAIFSTQTSLMEALLATATEPYSLK